MEEKSIVLREQAISEVSLDPVLASQMLTAMASLARGDYNTLDEALEATPGISVSDYHHALAEYPRDVAKLLSYAHTISSYEVALDVRRRELEMVGDVMRLRRKALNILLSDDVLKELRAIAAGAPSVKEVEIVNSQGDVVTKPVVRKPSSTAAVKAVEVLHQIADAQGAYRTLDTIMARVISDDHRERDDGEQGDMDGGGSVDKAVLAIIEAIGGPSRFSKVTASTPSGKTVSVSVTQEEIVDGYGEEVA